MDNSEPDRDNEQGPGPAIHIHIHSPENRIAARDFIEVNIYRVDRGGRKRAGENNEAPPATVRPVQIIRPAERTPAAGQRGK